MLRSFVEYISEHKGSKCGYCKGHNSSYIRGMWAHTMTVADYQDLIDRGWQRSGKYVYKPTMDIVCCPSYIIRCRALEFKASKSQKKVLKQFNKYLMGPDEKRVAGSGDHQLFSSSGDIRLENCGKSSQLGTSDDKDTMNDIKQAHRNVAGADPIKAPCKKAKQLRLERKLEKLKWKDMELSSPKMIKNKEKQVEDYINELPEVTRRKLQIKLVRTNPPSPEWLETAQETYRLYVKYRTAVHGDEPEKCTESNFNNFLVSSPLLEEYNEMGPACGYGSFHQQYWLDGKIIAVGVIDVLPKCLSSVSFFYDPQYSQLTLGTYGALREIEFTRRLNLRAPELKYYYMGFYILSCHKMKYKGNYFPSDLLCPETYKWFPLQDCIPKLEITPYSRLDPDIDSIDENYPKEVDIKNIPVFWKSKVVSYYIFKSELDKKEVSEELMTEYAKLVGAKTAKLLVMIHHY